MELNPKKWNRKVKMASAGFLAVVILGGCGTAIAITQHNNNVHTQKLAKENAKKKAKIELLAKEKQEKEEKQQKLVTSLLSAATSKPTDDSIKAVNEAIAKLTDQKEKAKDTKLVEALGARLNLIKKAQAAVKDYQAHATDANKQKIAQEAINNLKDKNDQAVKTQLQKLFDDSNKQAQEAAKSAQASQKASSTAGGNNNAKSTDTQTNDTPAVAESGTNNQATSNVNSGNNTYVPNTPNTGGGSNTASNGNSGNTASNSNSNNASNNSGGNTNNNNSNNNSNSNNGGGNVAPPVSHVFQAWVKNKAGAVIWTQNCSTWAEASAAAANYGNSQFASGNFDIGNYGVTQIS